ncbi:hypothetical protein EI94DRAFT_1832424 [Lactarius quietus]|nr:hypothetical protein EI94DRAFT_1832424 [Lactarius quietus]
MPPRTRRAQQAQKNRTDNDISLGRATGQHSGSGNVIERRDVGNVTQPQTNLTINGKRTSSNHEEGPGSRVDPGVQSTPAKRARHAGPVHSRPLQLKIVSDGEASRPPSGRVGVATQSTGKQRELQRTASFYPGYGGATSILDPEAEQFLNPTFEDPPVENEDDWIDDQETTTLAQGLPSKMAEARAFERPSWEQASAVDGPTPGSVSCPTEKLCHNVPASSQRVSGSAATAKSIVASAAPSALNAVEEEITETSTTWPAATNLKLIKGSKGNLQVMLTIQPPIIRSVITHSFEGLRASLLFENAFPDPIVSYAFIRDALITAASNYGPSAAAMYTRLVNDEEYVTTIFPVPRARISHFRSEVKEYSSAIMFPVIIAKESRTEIALFVQEQLSNYNYTFPRSPKNVGHGKLVMRSKPYRNMQLINIIRDAYFTANAGKAAFATRYKCLFQNTEDDEMTVYEVPIPMVALAATALYATLHEWRTGQHVLSDFSVNTYMDVYLGHINTLRLVKEGRYSAFHSMMVEIYAKASHVPTTSFEGNGAPVANLDLSDLEE